MCAITFRMPLSYDSEGRDSESLVQKRETVKLLGGGALGRENGGVLGRRVRAGGIAAGQGFLFPLVVLTGRGVIPFTEGSVGKELVSLRQKRERNYTGKHFFSLDLSLKVWSGRNGATPRHWAYCLSLDSLDVVLVWVLGVVSSVPPPSIQGPRDRSATLWAMATSQDGGGEGGLPCG